MSCLSSEGRAILEREARGAQGKYYRATISLHTELASHSARGQLDRCAQNIQGVERQANKKRTNKATMSQYVRWALQMRPSFNSSGTPEKPRKKLAARRQKDRRVDPRCAELTKWPQDNAVTVGKKSVLISSSTGQPGSRKRW